MKLGAREVETPSNMPDSNPEPTWIHLRRSPRVSRGLAVIIIASCIGLASGSSFVAENHLQGLPTVVNDLACGFEEGPDWGLVGSGVPSGTQYISTSTLGAYQTTVTPTATATTYAYGGGSGTEEYLVGEISFFCTALPSGNTIVTLAVSASSPLGASPTYGVLFVQTGTSAATDPTTTAACAGTAPNYLYEPSGGGSIWAWDAESGGLLSSGAGCVTAFTTGAISLSISTASTTLPIFTISFGFVGMPVSTCSTSCAVYTSYTASFTAVNP